MDTPSATASSAVVEATMATGSSTVDAALVTALSTVDAPSVTASSPVLPTWECQTQTCTSLRPQDDQTTQHGAGGDPDLKASVDASNGFGNAIYDACVLSFEFRCTSDAYVPRVSFNYIWGSEEYYEYVDSAFNDVFGFYLNGHNIALVPDTDSDSDIVSINNVNYKRNAKYFNGNDPGTGWQNEAPDAPDTEIVYHSIEADGFTDTMTAVGNPKEDPQQWNTIKMAVGDVGDDILDSWVLLESATFTCREITQAPSVSLSPSAGEWPTDEGRDEPHPVGCWALFSVHIFRVLKVPCFSGSVLPGFGPENPKN